MTRLSSPMHTRTRHFSSCTSAPGPEAGITLVEAATAVVIVCVLVAVAIPRFSERQGASRTAQVTALAGAMKAAAGLVKTSAVSVNVPCSLDTGAHVNVQGQRIGLNHCYPQALGEFGTGILAAANVKPDAGWAIASTGGSAPGTVLRLSLADAREPGSCSVSYTSASSTLTPPKVAVSVSGC
jgi:Tfp pilus assembly protein FimT